jgi:outer membrane murein-binding lipoprotein Lpp
VKFELKDYIAAATAVLTVGSVIWKGGEITSKLEQTAQAVKELAPVVNRLDATTARLEVQADANRSRIDDLTKRVEILESRRR